MAVWETAAGYEPAPPPGTGVAVMERVAIFGVGLIGGSFALALRRAGFTGEILGVSSPRTLEAALAMGVVDRAVNADRALEEADCIYLAQPILRIIDTIAEIGPKARPNTLITDAGSTKSRILQQAYQYVRHATFLGGHPMAGKERSGAQEAVPELFEGRPYVLVLSGSDDWDKPQVQEFHRWVTLIGARPILLDADQHDRLVAFTSHVPQLVSTALASVLADVAGAPEVAGPAVLELTRLALSPFSIWRDILATNDKHVEAALALLIAKLKDFQKDVRSEALAENFEIAASFASILRKTARN